MSESAWAIDNTPSGNAVLCIIYIKYLMDRLLVGLRSCNLISKYNSYLKLPSIWQGRIKRQQVPSLGAFRVLYINKWIRKARQSVMMIPLSPDGGGSICLSSRLRKPSVLVTTPKQWSGISVLLLSQRIITWACRQRRVRVLYRACEIDSNTLYCPCPVHIGSIARVYRASCVLPYIGQMCT